MLVSEVGIDDRLLLGLDLVEGRKLRGRWANFVHEANSHQHLGLDTRSEVLVVDVAESRPHVFFAFMKRIEVAEIVTKLFVGMLGQVHLPYTTVVAEKW